MFIDKTEKIDFKLAEGTEDERSVPWVKDAKLGENHDVLFATLSKLHISLVDVTLRQGASRLQNPMIVIIECLWLSWCYAAHDVAACKIKIAGLEERIERIERVYEQRIAQLEQQLLPDLP